MDSIICINCGSDLVNSYYDSDSDMTHYECEKCGTHFTEDDIYRCDKCGTQVLQDEVIEKMAISFVPKNALVQFKQNDVLSLNLHIS